LFWLLPLHESGKTRAQLRRKVSDRERAGRDTAKLQVGINSHDYVAETAQQAANEFFGPYSTMMNNIGRERAWSPMRFLMQINVGSMPHRHVLRAIELFGPR
jgi:alkanesulfonate monooxygenase SsuD/methylene tetrahydromethanopterin reductase-like flavin-dependent oxidoreductase (luciferase family)